jgi:hypothetical protein
VKGALDGRPIKVLAAYGKHLTLEGPDVEGVVIAELQTLFLMVIIVITAGNRRIKEKSPDIGELRLHHRIHQQEHRQCP